MMGPTVIARRRENRFRCAGLKRARSRRSLSRRRNGMKGASASTATTDISKPAIARMPARLEAGHFFAWLKKITRSPAGEQPETASLTPLRSRDAKTAREDKTKLTRL